MGVPIKPREWPSTVHQQPPCACELSRHVLSSVDAGHFKLSVTRDGVNFVTSCISYGASAVAVAAALDALDPVADLGGSAVARMGDGSSTAYDYGFVYHISTSDPSQNLVSSVGIELAGSGVEHGCARVSTLGYWEDAMNWDTGVVPASTDEVGCDGLTFCSYSVVLVYARRGVWAGCSRRRNSLGSVDVRGYVFDAGSPKPTCLSCIL